MRLRPIGHDDRLSVVDHLDELRARMFASVAILFIAFCLCFWQNHALINLMNRALPKSADSPITNTDKADKTIENALAALGRDAKRASAGLATSTGVSPQATAGIQQLSTDATRFSHSLKKVVGSEKNKPITIGVGESFTATLTVAAYFALLISMPFLLYQLYAFVLPALSKHERRVALPAMIAAPVLFIVGATFTYFGILPPAIHFLQGYNTNEFYVLVTAGTYFKFEVLLMGAIGLTFQIPLLLLALQRLGIVSSQTLTLNWRYGLVIIAVIGAALPGTDPVSLVFETAPLLVLYGASILLLKLVERRDRRKAAAEDRDSVNAL